MRRIGVVGLCLVAVFALTAVVASSASASPEYFICAKAKGTGKYEDKACSTLASPGPGNYERVAWTHAKKKLFKAKNEGSPLANGVNPFGPHMGAGEPGQILPNPWICEHEKVAGEVTGPRTARWNTTYTKCSALGTKCNSPGAKEGTIVTDPLESELVWLDKAHTKVGIKIRGLGPGGRLEHFECQEKATQVSVYGEPLAELQGDNGIASKSTKTVMGEGPLHLQSVGGTYVEEAFGSPENDEQAAKVWWEYEEALLACEKGEEPFPPGEKSQATCEALFGKPNPVPIKPGMLESVVTGAEEGVGPGVQTSVSNTKGEAFGIAEGPFAP